MSEKGFGTLFPGEFVELHREFGRENFYFQNEKTKQNKNKNKNNKKRILKQKKRVKSSQVRKTGLQMLQQELVTSAVVDRPSLVLKIDIV